MVSAVMRNCNWSSWFNIRDENLKKSLPSEPGVYQIRTDFEINRLKGSSELVYIGAANDSLSKRLSLKLFGNFTGLDRADKWLLFNSKNVLELRYVTTANESDAKYLEALLLWEYENKHWEIPPGNDRLEKKAIIDKIRHKHKGKIEDLLKDLLEQHKSNKEISNTLDMPEYVIENLRVFFLLYVIHPKRRPV